MIRPTRFGAPAAQVLVAAAQAEAAARYGSPDESAVESIQFDPPEGGFLVAWHSGEAIGCVGWRTLSHFSDDGVPEDVGEIKRMYAVPGARGTGVAQQLLAAVENLARAAGMHRMVLETGMAQPEAVRFYEKSGYQRITNYGLYRNDPACVSFGRDL